LNEQPVDCGDADVAVVTGTADVVVDVAEADVVVDEADAVDDVPGCVVAVVVGGAVVDDGTVVVLVVKSGGMVIPGSGGEIVLLLSVMTLPSEITASAAKTASKGGFIKTPVEGRAAGRLASQRG
jgi:hypothetical protein